MTNLENIDLSEIYYFCYINLYESLEVCGGQETFLDMSGASMSFLEPLYTEFYNKALTHMSKTRVLVTSRFQFQLRAPTLGTGIVLQQNSAF